MERGAPEDRVEIRYQRADAILGPEEVGRAGARSPVQTFDVWTPVTGRERVKRHRVVR